MLTDQQIVAFLARYGHLSHPNGLSRDIDSPLEDLSLESPEVIDAIQSFQRMNQPKPGDFWPLPVPNTDGQMDYATSTLMQTARCAVPDYAAAVAEAGVGNWKGCHGIGDAHCAYVKLLNEPPSFLKPVWNEVWDNNAASYAEQGLKLVLVKDGFANITLQFQEPDGGWIGLAIVGTRVTCGETIWARFDHAYRPQNIVNEWSTLITHEIGHNCGLGHSSGGKMNPYIVAGLNPRSWRGDPSQPALARSFGGKPIPGDEPDAGELVIARRFRDGSLVFESTLPEADGPWPGAKS